MTWWTRHDHVRTAGLGRLRSVPKHARAQLKHTDLTGTPPYMFTFVSRAAPNITSLRLQYQVYQDPRPSG